MATLTGAQVEMVSQLNSAILVIQSQNVGITRLIGDVDNIPFTPLTAAETAPVFAAIEAAYRARIAAIEAASP
jgi:hypothetical protein